MQERPPFRPPRFANQHHLHFLREAVAFAGVTRNARANHVFPGRGSTAISRHDVIKIQIIAIERVPAVLAGVFIALENTVAGTVYIISSSASRRREYGGPAPPP